MNVRTSGAVPSRLAVTAVAAVFVLLGLQAAAQPAAAAGGICTSSYCATLQILISGTGAGTVTSNDGAIECAYKDGVTSGTCFERYIWPYLKPDLEVTETVTPATGSYACRAMPPCIDAPGPIITSFYATPGSAYTAEFIFVITQRTLTVAASGTGSGYVYVSGSSISCPSTCSQAFDYGTALVLHAVPTAPSVFKGWTGACAGQGSACHVSMTADRTTTAEFGLPTAPPERAPSKTLGPTPASSVESAPASPGSSVLGATATPLAPASAMPGALASPSASADPSPATPPGSDTPPALPTIALVLVVGAVAAFAGRGALHRRPKA